MKKLGENLNNKHPNRLLPAAVVLVTTGLVASACADEAPKPKFDETQATKVYNPGTTQQSVFPGYVRIKLGKHNLRTSPKQDTTINNSMHTGNEAWQEQESLLNKPNGKGELLLQRPLVINQDKQTWLGFVSTSNKLVYANVNSIKNVIRKSDVKAGFCANEDDVVRAYGLQTVEVKSSVHESAGLSLALEDDESDIIKQVGTVYTSPDTMLPSDYKTYKTCYE